VSAPADYRVVIRLRRLGSKSESYYLNPDLIAAIESTPDTVLTLTTHTKLLVADSAEEVVAAIRTWRASVLSAALPKGRAPRGDAGLVLVRGAAGEPFHPEQTEETR
jgi:flagellar protein FlbD